MSKPKVLFLINSLGIGGAERVFVREINSLNSMGFKDIYISTIFKTKDINIEKDLFLDKDKFLKLDSTNLLSLNKFFKLVGFIKKNKIEIVYSTLNEANIWSRTLKLFIPTLKIFIREANVADFKPFKFKILDIFLNLFTFKIVAVSFGVKESLLKFLPFYEKKIVVISNGVDLPNLSKDYSNIKSPLHFLNVGSLTLKKGQKFLIEGVAKVLSVRPNSIILDIYGDGQEFDNLSSLIGDFKDNIKIHKPVLKDELNKIYLNSDVFVLSSLYEGSPNVLLEAMSFGLCSISTAVSGAEDIIKDRDSGILISKKSSEAIKDVIIELIDNKEKLSFYGENARKRINDNFSFNIHMEKIIRLFNLK